MSPLRKQMQADMVLRGLAPRTQAAYLAAVAGLARHYGRSPDQLTEEDVQRYLLHLIEERLLAWASTNQTACALRFFFHVTLKRPEASFRIPSRKAPAKLPEILSRGKVDRILDAWHQPTSSRPVDDDLCRRLAGERNLFAQAHRHRQHPHDDSRC